MASQTLPFIFATLSMLSFHHSSRWQRMFVTQRRCSQHFLSFTTNVAHMAGWLVSYRKAIAITSSQGCCIPFLFCAPSFPFIPFIFHQVEPDRKALVPRAFAKQEGEEFWLCLIINNSRMACGQEVRRQSQMAGVGSGHLPKKKRICNHIYRILPPFFLIRCGSALISLATCFFYRSQLPKSPLGCVADHYCVFVQVLPRSSACMWRKKSGLLFQTI